MNLNQFKSNKHLSKAIKRQKHRLKSLLNHIELILIKKEKDQFNFI